MQRAKAKTLLVILGAIMAQGLGDVCLTRGMKTIGEVSTLSPGPLLALAFQIFANPLIWGGIILLLTFFGLFLTALSWADLSFVLPVSAFGYVVNAALAATLLGERVTPWRWIGTLVICIGVFLVSRTEQRTTDGESPS
jgi:drug/metabolite transporter (DMT)-like permease